MYKKLLILALMGTPMLASAQTHMPQLLKNLRTQLSPEVLNCSSDYCTEDIDRDIAEKKVTIYVRHADKGHVAGFEMKKYQSLIVTGGEDSKGKGCAIVIGHGTKTDDYESSTENGVKALAIMEEGEKYMKGLSRDSDQSFLVTGYVRETSRSIKINEPDFAFSGKQKTTASVNSYRNKLVMKYHSATKRCIKEGRSGEDWLGKEYTECLESVWVKSDLSCRIDY